MENCKDLKIVLGGEDKHLNQEEKCIKYCQNQNQMSYNFQENLQPV